MSYDTFYFNLYAEKWCMHSSNISCDAQCISVGNKGGKLVIDGDVCPFKYFCQCECSQCVEKCASLGKLHVHKNLDRYGCSICNCQCQTFNCWKMCNGEKFLEINNTLGCSECKCLCPDIDCNAKCNGTSITRLDTSGCLVCDGCEGQETDGKIPKINDGHI